MSERGHQYDTLNKPLLKILEDGVSALGLSCPDNSLARLIQYLALLQKWNQAYNLTAVRDPVKMVSVHLLDSISVSPFLVGRKILDVGTGAGLPGIPLALINPDKNFVLLDSNAKKTRFVRQAKMEIKLKNVEIVRSRLEAFQVDQKFDIIVTRAFTDLCGIVTGTRHLLRRGGQIAAMKGRLSAVEIGQIAEFKPRIVPIIVPGVDAERHLVLVSPSSQDA